MDNTGFISKENTCLSLHSQDEDDIIKTFSLPSVRPETIVYQRKRNDTTAPQSPAHLIQKPPRTRLTPSQPKAILKKHDFLYKKQADIAIGGNRRWHEV